MLKGCFEEKDSNTSLFISKYCGKIDYEFAKKRKDLTISLPENDHLFGKNALYCEYTVHNSEEIESLTIHSKKIWGKLYMKIEYLDSLEDKEFTLGNEEKYNIYKSKKIKIIFQSNDVQNNSPFSVKISDTLSTFNSLVLLFIIACAFLFIIFSIICFLYIKKQKKKMGIILGNDINRNIIVHNMGYNSERNELINYINNLQIKKYKEIKEKSLNNNCPFEMENFDDNSEVIFTKCRHSFHINCLREYINKNIEMKEFKCLLCNNSLYKVEDQNNIKYV